MSQFIKLTVFNASLTQALAKESGEPYVFIFGASAEGGKSGRLYFSSSLSGQKLRETLKAQPFKQGSTVEVTLAADLGNSFAQFQIVGLEVKEEGLRAAAVLVFTKKAVQAPAAPATAGAQAPATSEVRVR